MVAEAVANGANEKLAGRMRMMSHELKKKYGVN